MFLLPLVLSSTITFAEQDNIYLEVIAHPEKQHITFLAPHENESVVNAYLTEQVMAKGGIFVILRQKGERNIYFTIDGKNISIDPNRLFSNRGITRSLSRLNLDLEKGSKTFEKAVARAEALGNFILSTMKADQINNWIAIHNNTNGYSNDGNGGIGTISIKRYQKKLAEGANYLIKVNDAGQDEDDLFFITEPADFKKMQAAGWNVVLQNPAVASDPNEDDGSLSVLAEKRDKRYVNIEAERAKDDFGEDHLEVQKAMVDLIFAITYQDAKTKVE